MLRFILSVLLSLMMICIISLTVVSIIVIPELPDIETLKDVRMQVPLRVYTHEGALIAEFGEKRRTPINIKDVQKNLINAFVAAEDDRYFRHPGVDWQGLARATLNLIQTGEKSQGGSTITMQAARNIFYTSEKTYWRKINEIFLALKMETGLTKEEILELYLNVIYFGQRAYGVGAAAQVYYGSNVNELTLAQIAMIAGLPKAPSTTNPVTNSERAKDRRSYVLGRMLELGYINQTEYDIANESPITASLHKPSTGIEAPYVAEMVRKQLVDQYGDEATTAGYKVTTTIRNKNQVAANHALRMGVLEYDTRHGYREPESHIDLETVTDEDDWKQLLETFPVIANLYPALITDVREQSVTAFLTGIGIINIGWEGLVFARKYIDQNTRGPELKNAGDIITAGDVVRVIEDEMGQWRLSQLPVVEAAFVSLDPNNGATLALTGGFDFSKSSFNRVTQASRQPGSGFKPFIYSAALEQGYTAASIINDAPLVKEFAGVEDIWRPENFSGRYYGPTRLREALVNSRNIVSIRLLDAVGIEQALDHIVKFGFDSSHLPHSLSLALGSGDLSPWQMATSYCVFANGGYKVNPHFIERIEDYNDQIIFEAIPYTICRDCETDQELPADLTHNPTKTDTDLELNTIPQFISVTESDQELKYAPRVINAENIWIMNSITRDVIRRGTGRRALVLNRSDISGKTGTTNDQHDAWFYGYNSAVVAVAWVGFDNFTELGRNEVGGKAALPIWIEYMQTALADIPEYIPEQPSGTVTAKIDPTTGQLANADNPDAIFEVFRSKYVPNTVHKNLGADTFVEKPEYEKIPENPF